MKNKRSNVGRPKKHNCDKKTKQISFWVKEYEHKEIIDYFGEHNLNKKIRDYILDNINSDLLF